MITKHYQLEVRPSSIDRTGCFAGEAIPAGALFAEYTGERIDRAEAVRREADPARTAVYTLWLDDGVVIDGMFGGNETIYMNHSCEPNCFLEEAEARVFVGAARAIAAGEELTIDYAYDPATPLEACRCGAESCRGYLNEVVEGPG
jgi:uncharacterized protein